MAELNSESAESIEKILELEQETMVAIKNKNTDALSQILSDDFIYRTPFGVELNKIAFLQNIASLNLEIIDISGDNLQVSVFQETAVLTGVQRVKARIPEGREDTGATAFTDVFVKRQGQWLMVLAYGVELPANID